MIGIAFGTRPEYIKLKHLYAELQKLNIPVTWVRIGQHDSKMNMKDWDNIDTEIFVDPYDPHFPVDRLSNVITSVLNTLDTRFENIKLMIVQGDTASAFAIALKCFNLGIPVAHVEAGLRSFSDDPYPEEAYRKMITALAKYHFCPSQHERSNIDETERGRDYRLIVTGNTFVDNIKEYKGVEKKKLVICTIHRRESRDFLESIFYSIIHLAKNNQDYDFLLTTHPSIHNDNYISFTDVKNIKVSPPLDHKEFLEHLQYASHVITDSGGISEEANYLDAITIVVRNVTEREACVDYLIAPIFMYDAVRHSLKDLNKLIKKSDPYAYGRGFQTKISTDIAGIIKNIYLYLNSSLHELKK